jgi:hypothetical protein
MKVVLKKFKYGWSPSKDAKIKHIYLKEKRSLIDKIKHIFLVQIHFQIYRFQKQIF